MAEVFGILESLKAEGTIVEYAIGGAMAVLFYAEPLRTYDLDVFVILPPESGGLVSLTPLYERLAAQGFQAEAEHVLIHEVPVQFLPAWNDLAEESLRQAIVKEYDSGTSTRVIRPEHLVALAVQTGGPKRREHVFRLLETAGFDTKLLDEILGGHGLMDKWRKEWARP
jgi:hypothetical protein